MVIEKGPGDIKYPTGKPKNLEKMGDGNPYPYEREYFADGGVQDDEKIENVQPQPKYNPKPLSNEGDDGLGGHK